MSQAKMYFKPGSRVWVWDSTWLPAVVVRRAPIDQMLVRLEHGVTFSTTSANLLPCDAVRQHARPAARCLSR